MSEEKEMISNNFIYRLVEEDLKNGTFNRQVCTRFPPEPNGYLHAGEYVNSIIEDINWLGYSPGNRIFYGSDYLDEIFNAAITLIKKGKAYICELSPKEIKEYRGTLTESGKSSPFRNRPIEESLELFLKMKNGEFPTGSMVLRDMESPNINMRDPILYRIIHANHYRTGGEWCIYPMYEFTHPIQDAIVGVTHSLCSIEFKDHRPLYEWVLTELDIKEPPKQREFGRVNLTGVVTSKRYLRELVAGKFVDGWDDPRLPTIRGLKRRGFTPESIRKFIDEIGFVKHQSTVDYAMLEITLRNELKLKVNCVMAVLNPLKVTITNYEEGKREFLQIDNNSENADLESRDVPFSKIIYIEKEDFMEIPIKGFKRLSLHEEVRLKGAYFIKCNEVIKDDLTGEVIELKCTYDSETKSGTGFTGRKVKGTIHWVSALHGVSAEIHLFEKLFEDEEIVKNNEKTWDEKINPRSQIILEDCIIEPLIKNSKVEDKLQFIRHGYFCIDKNSTDKKLIINRSSFERFVARKNVATMLSSTFITTLSENTNNFFSYYFCAHV